MFRREHGGGGFQRPRRLAFILTCVVNKAVARCSWARGVARSIHCVPGDAQRTNCTRHWETGKSTLTILPFHYYFFFVTQHFGKQAPELQMHSSIAPNIIMSDGGVLMRSQTYGAFDLVWS
jgi:hypothetical protein